MGMVESSTCRAEIRNHPLCSQCPTISCQIIFSSFLSKLFSLCVQNIQESYNGKRD